MIRTVALVLAFLNALVYRAAASSPSVQTCQANFVSLASCQSVLSADCDDDQTLFEVLNPAVVCPNSCITQFKTVFTNVENLGCCSTTSFYTLPSSSSCGTGTELSFTGLTYALDYFCSDVEYDGDDYYCFRNATDYLSETYPVILATQTLIENNDAAGAQSTFNAGVDCSRIVDTQCCYPTITTFANGCGDESSQEQAAQISQWENAIKQLCQNFQPANVPTFSDICDGLTEVTQENCLAENDPNCTGGDDDDDDGAATLTATFGAMLSAVAFANQL